MAPKSASPSSEKRASRIAVPGGHLAAEVAGAGSSVLFLHSVIADGRMWDRDFSRCAASHRAIRFDLRGFGGSTPAAGPFSLVDDVRAVLRHVRASRAFVVGSSMGGAIAIDYALAHPQTVEGLLLVAPGLSGGFEPPFETDEKAAFAEDEERSNAVAAAWSRGDRAAAFGLLRQLWCAALTGSNLELFRRMVEENAAEVFDNRSLRLAVDGPPAAPRLGSLSMPTTVLVGDRDNPSSPVFAKRIARAIPGARLRTVPGADHLINLSRPDEFDRALDEAIGEIGTPARRSPSSSLRERRSPR